MLPESMNHCSAQLRGVRHEFRVLKLTGSSPSAVALTTAPVAETRSAPVAETRSAPVAETRSAPVVETRSAPVVETRSVPAVEIGSVCPIYSE